jgi:hypothetical protein
LSRDDHRLLPDGVHTGPDNWNRQWADWIEQFGETANRQDVLEQLARMRQAFGI